MASMIYHLIDSLEHRVKYDNIGSLDAFAAALTHDPSTIAEFENHFQRYYGDTFFHDNCLPPDPSTDYMTFAPDGPTPYDIPAQTPRYEDSTGTSYPAVLVEADPEYPLDGIVVADLRTKTIRTYQSSREFIIPRRQAEGQLRTAYEFPPEWNLEDQRVCTGPIIYPSTSPEHSGANRGRLRTSLDALVRRFGTIFK